MGKLVVSWSPVHGQSGTTANTVALASMFSLDQPYRSLLTHTQLTFSTLESLYAKGNRATGFDDAGMDALERLVKSNLLKPEAVSDYTDTIYKNRLDLLFGNQKEQEESQENEDMFRSILHKAKIFYDVLWVDAHSGIYNPTTRTLLKDADLVLVNLPQNRYVIERFFSGEDFPEELKEKNYLALISMYDEKAAYSLRNIRRSNKVKIPMYSIPYATGFRDAANQSMVTEFFGRSVQVKKGDASYPFIRSLRDVNQVILKQLGYTAAEDDDL
ncbi:hypothetical protein [Bacillus sp. FJAT-29937]|uniref:hypothetical protein n=1 Tax=Bacillus sp. FJAT-29937 TaxID=1720553 RepID=UPI0008368579|nr:hypothetical protein [Bacillus sp. FJAT-29937]